MMTRIIPFASLIAALFLFFSCKNPDSSSGLKASDTQVAAGELPASFIDFYKKFHTDSAYQMAHITWPLQGAKGFQVDSSHSEPRNVYWQQSEWRMHRAELLESSDFVRERKAIGDVLVIERVRAKAVPFGIERRFAKQANNEWELIYYADVLEFKE